MAGKNFSQIWQDMKNAAAAATAHPVVRGSVNFVRSGQAKKVLLKIEDAAPFAVGLFAALKTNSLVPHQFDKSHLHLAADLAAGAAAFMITNSVVKMRRDPVYRGSVGTGAKNTLNAGLIGAANALGGGKRLAGKAIKMPVVWLGAVGLGVFAWKYIESPAHRPLADIAYGAGAVLATGLAVSMLKRPKVTTLASLLVTSWALLYPHNAANFVKPIIGYGEEKLGVQKLALPILSQDQAAVLSKEVPAAYLSTGRLALFDLDGKRVQLANMGTRFCVYPAKSKEAIVDNTINVRVIGEGNKLGDLAQTSNMGDSLQAVPALDRVCSPPVAKAVVAKPGVKTHG